jgi:4,5:9,10-diseco-3-hydroxy-5,9,17-trioxoandrosta-1(10),2-diene-4-oate hydrolase
LLLLHGLGHWTAGAWDRLVPQLDPAYRIVAIDLPGFGASDRPDAPYDLPFFRSILAGVAAQSLPARFVLGGHSLGGLIAADFAAAFPGWVECLALIAPAGFRAVAPPIVRLLGSPLAWAIFRRHPPRSFVRWTLQRSVVRREAIDDETVAHAFALAQDSGFRRAYARIYGAAAQLDLPALHRHLARYTGPAIVAWGRHDRYLPITALGNARRVYPQAIVEVLEQSAHIVMLDEPERLGAAMGRLLGENTRVTHGP